MGGITYGQRVATTDGDTKAAPHPPRYFTASDAVARPFFGRLATAERSAATIAADFASVPSAIFSKS